MSVPVAVATPELTLYQSDKAWLRNYIINISKRSSRKYPRDVQWVVDEIAAIRSVPVSATYKEWFKTLAKFIIPPAEAWVKISGTRRQRRSFHECFRKFRDGCITDTMMSLRYPIQNFLLSENAGFQLAKA